MERLNFFRYCGFLLAVLAMLCSFRVDRVSANVYTVGDEEEWSSQTNFASWAEKYNFSVGDVLVFKYVKGEHNTYEVTEDTFRSCDASSGVLAKYESGEDRVELNEVKRYWFICNVAGHCLGGMRFGIQVNGRRSNATLFGPLTPQIQPTPMDNSGTSYTSERWRVIIYFIPFGLFFNLYFL